MYKILDNLTEENKNALLGLQGEVYMQEATSFRRRVGVNGPNNLKCSYSVALNETLGKVALEKLKSMAPEFEGSTLAEVVVNKYEPGDFLPEHFDKTSYTHNVLINLQSSEDGIQIEDTHYPDEEGRAIIFNKLGVRHSVPPVKNLRYTLMYLYERG